MEKAVNEALYGAPQQRSNGNAYTMQANSGYIVNGSPPGPQSPPPYPQTPYGYNTQPSPAGPPTNYYEQKASQQPSMPSRICVVTCALDEQVLRFLDMQLSSLPTMVRSETAVSADSLRQLIGALQQQGVFVDAAIMHPQFASTFAGVVEEVRRRGVPVILCSANPSMRAAMGADDFIDGPSFGSPFNQADLANVLARWHESTARPYQQGAPAASPMMGGMAAPALGGNLARGSMTSIAPGSFMHVFYKCFLPFLGFFVTLGDLVILPLVSFSSDPSAKSP